MTNIKNWILTASIAVLGVLDLIFGVLNDVAAELTISPKVVTYVRVAILVVGAIVLKLQAPSTNPEKLRNLVYKAEEKKRD